MGKIIFPGGLMSKTGSANGSFFGNFIYDQLLRRRPHFLSDLSRAVDFSFVKAALRDFYVGWGRDPWDPVLMFKMVFLQFLYDLSDRDIEEQCTWNMLFKSFLGLSAEELPPDHTVLCRFRQRLGAEGFQRLFNQVVEQARAQGLVSDRLHIIDATHMTAKVDLFRLKQVHQDGDDDDHYVDRSSPDPDARFGRKGPKKGFYGYKSHMVQAATTPGNVPDGAVLSQVAQSQAQEMTGDKAYDSKTNRTHLAKLGVSCGLIPRRRGSGRPRNSWRERPKIERKFAECKQFHGLRQARYWGLEKVTIQTLMVALVVNLKRWVTLLKLRSPAYSWANAV
jgi:IS5 family transposase